MCSGILSGTIELALFCPRFWNRLDVRKTRYPLYSAYWPSAHQAVLYFLTVASHQIRGIPTSPLARILHALGWLYMPLNWRISSGSKLPSLWSYLHQSSPTCLKTSSFVITKLYKARKIIPCLADSNNNKAKLPKNLSKQFITLHFS